jgi:hypothetical protein
MKNPELFHQTVSTLVKAYQNDTLMYADCRCCAVGNIVAAVHNVKLVNDNGCIIGNTPPWGGVVDLGTGKIENRAYKDCHYTTHINNLLKTGYTVKQCALIEYAFYLGTSNNGTDTDYTDTFNGLMSVIDTLMQIHEATETEAKEAKELFVKA